MQAPSYSYFRRLETTKKGFPGKYLYDPDHYERELEVFYYNMWVAVGRTDEVPNPRDYKTFTVGRQNVMVVRDLKGELGAFHNTCRHRGSILCTEETGSFQGGSIVCPYHAWTYSLDGGLIATPHQLESADFDMTDYSLYNVAVDTWAGFLFLNLAGDKAPPLSSVLGNMPSRFENYHMENLRLGKRIVLDVKANWKLLFENFAECFHCPTVHPEYCSIVVSDSDGGQWGIKEDEFGNAIEEIGSRYLSGAATMTMDGTSEIPPFRGLTEEERDIIYTGGVIRPNLFLNIHPDYINSHIMFPTGPESVRMVYDWLFEAESMELPDFNLDKYVEMWDITNRQDARNCQWQQSGIRSNRFESSIFVPQEFGPHNFNEWVVQCLEGDGVLSQVGTSMSG